MFTVHKQNKASDTDILQNEIESLIDRQRQRTMWVQWSVWVLLAIVFLLTTAQFTSTLTRWVHNTMMSPLERLRMEQSRAIKQAALNQLITPPDLEHIRQVLHEVNSDFYGYNQPKNVETFLTAWAGFPELDSNDPFHLDRPFPGNPAQSWRQWLLDKTKLSDTYGGYYNPRFETLEKWQAATVAQLNTVLNTPLPQLLSDSLSRTLRRLPKSYGKLKALLTFELVQNDHFIEAEQALQKRVDAQKLEKDARLALLAVQVARDLGFKRPAQWYGWFKGSYKGARLMSYKSRASSEWSQDWNTFNKHLLAVRGSVRAWSKNDDPVFILQNPLHMPLQAKFVGRYGARRKNNQGRLYKHHGIDLKAPEGQPVYPVAAGWVTYVGYQARGHGNHIRIRHDHGWMSVYSHLKSDRLWDKLKARFKEEGPFWVDTNEILASVGTTGNIPANDAQYGYAHLHFEILRNGVRYNPEDLLAERVTPVGF